MFPSAIQFQLGTTGPKKQKSRDDSMRRKSQSGTCSSPELVYHGIAKCWNAMFRSNLSAIWVFSWHPELLGGGFQPDFSSPAPAVWHHTWQSLAAEGWIWRIFLGHTAW